MGVLLIYSEPVVAKNETSNINTLKVTKKAKKKAKKVVKKTSQKKKKVKSAKKKVVKSKNKKKTTYKQTTRVRYNVGEIQSYAHQLVLEYGWNEADYQALVLLVNRESSWNPYSVNKKSKATGLCQALPGKKMASHGKDWRTNYKTQLRWCRDYIKNRYKTPSQAWNFWQSHHWF